MLLHHSGLRAAGNDAVHAEFVSLGKRRKFSVAIPGALRALDEIESLRTTHVRGDMPDREQAAKLAFGALPGCGNRLFRSGGCWMRGNSCSRFP